MALHPLRSAAPLTWRCTRSERVQCLRIGCTAHTNKPNREYAHLHMGRHCTTGRVRTLLRVCLCGCGPGRLSLLGLALCRRDQRRARPRCRWAAAGPGRGAGGRRQGQAAAPVGGGGAWPGFETTRRAKLAARTASGRATAHGCIKQPGPANTTKPPGPTGDRAAHASGR